MRFLYKKNNDYSKAKNQEELLSIISVVTCVEWIN